jgi:uncharacterized protein
MKIAIISDIHDNIPNLEKVLKYCQKNNIETIICCGDIADEETLARLAEFSGEVYAVLGNLDEGHLDFNEIKDKYANVHLDDIFGTVVLDGRTIGFSHKPEDAKYLIDREDEDNFDLVFYGHTHKPWEEIYHGVKLVNPGNVANQFYQPSFAVLETTDKELKLIILNNLSE